MKPIYSQLDYNYQEQKYEENNQPSQTIPDQTMTMREIIDRFANGGVIEQFHPNYEDIEDFDEILPDPRHMDLADRQELAYQYAQEFKEWGEKPLPEENEGSNNG